MWIDDGCVLAVAPFELVVKYDVRVGRTHIGDVDALAARHRSKFDRVVVEVDAADRRAIVPLNLVLGPLLRIPVAFEDPVIDDQRRDMACA